MLFTKHFCSTSGRGRGILHVKSSTVVPLVLELPFHIFFRHERQSHSFVKLQTSYRLICFGKNEASWTCPTKFSETDDPIFTKLHRKVDSHLKRCIQNVVWGHITRFDCVWMQTQKSQNDLSYQNSGMWMQVSSIPTNSSLQDTPKYQFSLQNRQNFNALCFQWKLISRVILKWGIDW
jgi:hypothetical protein